MQALALINAHTAMRIDRARQASAKALLQINYPNYLRPFPSCGLAQFDVHGSGVALPPGVQQYLSISFECTAPASGRQPTVGEVLEQVQRAGGAAHN